MSVQHRFATQLTRWLASLVPKNLRQTLKDNIKAELRREIRAELKPEIKVELKQEIKAELRREIRAELKPEIKVELKQEIKAELKLMMPLAMQQQRAFEKAAGAFEQRSLREIDQAFDEKTKATLIDKLSLEWRVMVRKAANLPGEAPQPPLLDDLLQEFSFIEASSELLAPVFKALKHKRVLYAGQIYYYAWYLSRALRERGWKADVLNWDLDPASQIYFHGQDFGFDAQSPTLTAQMLQFYVASLYAYDLFHFSNAHGISFGWPIESLFKQRFSKHADIRLLKALGKKIAYTNNSCLDGVSQNAFAKWGAESVCAICRWRNEPSVCSDERNLTWGAFRNSVADYQCLLGGNRADYNVDPRVHEVPQVYCQDSDFWRPDITIPEAFRLPVHPTGTVWLYHAVGNKKLRTTEDGVNIKSSHVYLPLIKKLKDEGLLIELLEPEGIPNRDVRFLQVQADIFLEMLTYGWFGANAREAMLLGRPVICYIRPEWLASLREELPDYAAELPIISATPATVEGILRDLIAHPDKRREIGLRSREFAVKWHSAEAGGQHFDGIYRRLLQGDPLLRVTANPGADHA